MITKNVIEKTEKGCWLTTTTTKP